MTGKVISISGADGTGKSTQMNLLKEHFSQLGYRCESHLFCASGYEPRARRVVEQLADNDVVFTRLSIDLTDRYPLMRDFLYTTCIRGAAIG